MAEQVAESIAGKLAAVTSVNGDIFGVARLQRADFFFLGSNWCQDQGFEVSSGQKRWEFYVVGLGSSFSNGLWILIIIIHEPAAIEFFHLDPPESW